MNSERKLIKVGNKYKLTIDNDETGEHFVKLHSKGMLKEIYRDDLKPNKQGLDANIAQIKSQIKKVNVEDTPELRRMIAMQKKAIELQKKEQLELQLKKMEEDRDTVALHMKEIETAIPEVKRMPKKK